VAVVLSISSLHQNKRSTKPPLSTLSWCCERHVTTMKVLAEKHPETSSLMPFSHITQNVNLCDCMFHT
jgi:hypothetical protein